MGCRGVILVVVGDLFVGSVGGHLRRGGMGDGMRDLPLDGNTRAAIENTRGRAHK